MRNFKKPLAVKQDLPNFNSETNVIFSPDENYILTGTAGRAVNVGSKQVELPERAATSSQGQLVVLRRSDLEVVSKLSISDGSVVKTVWNERINQLMLSTSLGAVHVLYNPETSVKGATLALGRLGKPRSTASDEVPVGAIITPHALPMFQDDPRLMGRTGKRKRERERQDPVKTMKPLPPVTGPGKGGRVGASATQHMVQGLNFNRTRDEDVRPPCFHNILVELTKMISLAKLCSSMLTRMTATLCGLELGSRVSTSFMSVPVITDTNIFCSSTQGHL